MSTTDINIPPITTGRKVFFIYPNLTIFPESFCADYMAMGFECYFIMKDSAVPIEEKIDILVDNFKDVVLFFFIDSPEPKPGVTWFQFLKSFKGRYQNPPLVGVFYMKRPSQSEVEKMNFLYKSEANVTCGTYMLDFNKRKNFDIILQILSSISAIGRRKNVRVICAANCKMRFTYSNKDYFLDIIDMSLSHFTSLFDSGTFPVDVNERIKDIEFNIKGLRFGHKVTTLLKRQVDKDKELCVFAFTNKDDQPGLDPNIKDVLLDKLYSLSVENFNRDFTKFYDEKHKKALEEKH